MNSGKVVTIPAEDVTIGYWNGTGYIIMNLEIGVGAYMITGGLNGGSSNSKYQNASAWEIATKRTANVNELSPNPLDEFSNTAIGPSDIAVSRYIRGENRTGTISEPIIVQKLTAGGYEIVNGHHRWWAAIKSGLETVPIKIINLLN